MANETCKTAEKDEKFFAALAKLGTVGAACRAAHYSRATVYRWKRDDEDFARCWQEADDHYVETMESEADRRALKGTLRPVFYKGEKVGSIREFSDTLLIFRLKGKRPDKYRESYHSDEQREDDSTDNLVSLREALTGARTAPAPIGEEATGGDHASD